MKTTRNRLLNIVITMSVVINLALLVGIGYIAVVDNHVNQLCSAMNAPVIVYVNKATKIPENVAAIKSPAKE